MVFGSNMVSQGTSMIYPSWLLCHGRVNTLDRLARFGIVTTVSCCFCVGNMESCQHLFLACPYSQFIITELFIHNMQLAGFYLVLAYFLSSPASSQGQEKAYCSSDFSGFCSSSLEGEKFQAVQSWSQKSYWSFETDFDRFKG